MRFASIVLLLSSTAIAAPYHAETMPELVKDGVDLSQQLVTDLGKDVKAASQNVSAWGTSGAPAFVWDGPDCKKLGTHGSIADADPAKAEPVLECFATAIGSDPLTWKVIAARDLPSTLASIKTRVTDELAASSSSVPHVLVLGTRKTHAYTTYVLVGWEAQHGWAHWELTTLAVASDASAKS